MKRFKRAPIRTRFPANAAIVYRKRLQDYIHSISALVRTFVAGELKSTWTSHGLRGDSASDDIRSALDNLSYKLSNLLDSDQTQRMAEDAVSAASQQAQLEFQREIEAALKKKGKFRKPVTLFPQSGNPAVPVDLPFPFAPIIPYEIPGITLPMGQMEDIIKSSVHENVRLINDIPDKILNSISNVVNAGVTSGQTYSSVAESIQEITGMAPGRANLIAVDQMSRVYSGIIRERHDQLGIETNIWITAQDENVCPVCGPMHLQSFEAAYLRKMGWPPRHVRCRCVVIADPDELLAKFI